MPHDQAPDLSAVEHWLVTARIASRHHWDMLVFLYRHQTSLVSAEHIARLLGYTTGEVVAALEYLEALGLVARSRVSQGVRLYQFTAPADTPSGDACHRLMRVADSRAVRLFLAKRWRQGSRRPDTNTRAAGLRGLEERKTWRKAS
jgi:biotin operon repressor